MVEDYAPVLELGLTCPQYLVLLCPYSIATRGNMEVKISAA